jgi:acetyl-CoA carboxylase biotin carboxylase subunit
VSGVETTLPLHRRLASNADIAKGAYDIHWLEKFLGTKI